jgi:hypothetical protein
MRKLLIVILLLATVAVYARVFSEKPKPRKLTPEERLESVGPNRKEKG